MNIHFLPDLPLIRTDPPELTPAQWRETDHPAEAIIQECADKYWITYRSMFVKYRHGKFCLARREAMWRIRSELGWSFPRLGRLFRLHHTTVMEGVRVHGAARR